MLLRRMTNPQHLAALGQFSLVFGILGIMLSRSELFVQIMKTLEISLLNPDAVQGFIAGFSAALVGLSIPFNLKAMKQLRHERS